MNYNHEQQVNQILKRKQADEGYGQAIGNAQIGLQGAGRATPPDSGAYLNQATPADRPATYLETTNTRLNYLWHELSSLNNRLYRVIERTTGAYPMIAQKGDTAVMGQLTGTLVSEIDAKFEMIFAELSVIAENVNRVETII